MTIVYSVSNPSVTPVIRTAEEGQLIRIQFNILRDGATIVGSIDQHFGAAKTNAEMRDELLPVVREIVENDYKEQTQASLIARCASIQALLADFSKTLP